jgi:Zn-dependent peptidase ImmA (M78 family)/transcriptional regulator with XRE-family HTH domain
MSQHAVAKNLRVSRTLIAQMELGNRPVSDEELLQLASLYGRTLVELKGTTVSEDDDPVTAALIKAAPELATDEMQRWIHGVLGLLMATSDLERLLDRSRRTGPPSYGMPPPRTPADAIEQGEQLAERERQRLGLREQPIGEIADLTAMQGVHVFALDLPDSMSGLFMRHSSIGSAIVVNATFDAGRQRLAIAHGYAHAVIEPAGTVRVCMHANAKELLERRADAFAGGFLLPVSGVDETVRGLGKGQPSRQVQWVFDAATERSVRAEERSTPGSQVMTYLDVASIARRFGGTYKLTVSRLLSLGVISESDGKRLLRPRCVEFAREWLTLFRPGTPRVQSPVAVPVLSDLDAERAYMAVEAYRRGLITKADLVEEAVTLSLKVPGLSETKLLAFAEAAR